MAGTSSYQAELRIAAERAVESWPIDVRELALVSLSENAVFRVDATNGGAYALRIHRPGYNLLPELESELCWTSALREAGISVPTSLRTSEGRGYAAVVMPGWEEPRQVGVVEWVEGVSLARLITEERDISAIGRHFVELGRIAARTHNQASAWTPPPGFMRRSWDADGLVGPGPLWGRFWEVAQLRPAQRDLLARARTAVWTTLQDLGRDAGTYGLIHADLHAHNVLVDGERLTLIDFDDAGFGWHQYDLAVALSSHWGEPSFGEIRAALIAGYRSERPLDEAALSLLPMFLLIRRLVLLGWVHGRPELDHGELLAPRIEAACADADAFLSGRLT